ncbi:4-hydroxy-tetrahydrodipicolinate synthase [Paenibacillus naphthalenovorans]|uniref:4-hydroxy-tetrahydrodipicolinate synthase n=1 Tax=Paenibacillus naphthalenovorans TaxID=162209 RepID=UPI003D2745D3
MLKPEGIIPAMVTPFTSSEEVNEPVLRQLVKRYVDAGVHGLFCLGTNGEFFSLTFDEKIRIAEIIIDEVKGKVPVYVGAGCITTSETVRMAKKLEEIGADALSVITPYFLTFTQDELVEHFKRIADSTRLPVVLYNIPSRTGNSLLPGSVGVLSQIPNIVGIKDSSGSFDNTLQYLDAVEPEFSVLAGTDSLILPTLMAGGKGAIAATANILPETVVSIYTHWQAGRFAEAEEGQKQLRAIRSAMGLGTLPTVLKEAMNIMGLPVGPARAPVAALPEAKYNQLMKVMDAYIQKGVIQASNGSAMV